MHPHLRSAVIPVIESLENRCLLAASALLSSSGVLRITGTEGVDIVSVTLNAKGTQLTVTGAGRIRTFTASQVRRVEANLLGGNDQLKVGDSRRPEIDKTFWITGGGGNDSLSGSAGFDKVIGNAGNDTLWGGARHDWIEGNDGNDRLLGQGGNDTLRGYAGDDRLEDTIGTNSLDGGPGIDTINGKRDATTPTPTPPPTPNPTPNPNPTPTPNPNPNPTPPSIPNPNPQPSPNPAPNDPDPVPLPNPNPTADDRISLDLLIRKRKDETWIGGGEISDTGVGQVRRIDIGIIPEIYELRITNTGSVADRFIITGPGDSDGFHPEYFDSAQTAFHGGDEITHKVTRNGWVTDVIQPGGSLDIRVDVRPTFAAIGGSTNLMRIKATSYTDPSKVDAVRAESTATERHGVDIRRRNFDDSGTYRAQLQNESNVTQSLIVRGPSSGDGWTARYFDAEFGGNDITSQVTSDGWHTPALAAKQHTGIRIQITRNPGVKARLRLDVSPAADPSATDSALFITERPVASPPFFVIGVWSQPTYNFAKWKSRGINTLFGYESLSGTVSMNQWISAANAQQLYQIRKWRSDPSLDKNEPYLLAWEHHDEPDQAGGRGDNDLPNYNALKAIAPHIPVTGNYAGSQILRWNPGTIFPPNLYDDAGLNAARDWGSQGVYPIGGWNKEDELDAPGRALDRVEKMMGGKPQISIIESGDQNMSWMPPSLRGPDRAELRAEIWDSVIRGARGIAYFPFRFLPTFSFDNVPGGSEVEAEMKIQHQRLKDLSPVLMSPIDPPQIGAEPAAANSPLQISWRQHNGRNYIIALNLSNRTLSDAAIRLHGMSQTGTASVRLEGRNVNISSGQLRDTFTPYAVHIYELPASGGSLAAVAPAAAPVMPAPSFAAEPIEPDRDVLAAEPAALF